VHGGYRAWRRPPLTGGKDQDEGYTEKTENQIFLIYKEIQNGAVAKS
jgi:hypothetical protein